MKDAFEMREDGLYTEIETVEEKGKPKKIWVKVSDAVEVIGNVCDAAGHEYSVAVEWTDDRSRTKRLVVPLRDFGAHPHAIVSRFHDQGLRVELDQHMSFVAYLWSAHQNAQQMELAKRTGWYDGYRVFVLPDGMIGEPSTPVIYDPPSDAVNYFGTGGSYHGWREMAGLYIGNSRLVFAVSLAFAAPLISLVSAESIGVHLRGHSSLGKTTAQKCAGAVWGGGGKNGFVQSWATTLAGLEGTAYAHTDALLALDEIIQADARNVVSGVYLLLNGRGKGRANPDGSSKQRASWTITLLSSGEVSLAEHAEKKPRGGAELRLLNIEADASKGLGLFEHLHGTKARENMTPEQAFAVDLSDAAMTHYGHAGREFVTRLASLEPDVHTDLIRDYQNTFRNTLNLTGATSEVQRAANNFALVAAGGELASAWDITGWPEGEANKQVKRCFESWLEHHGGKSVVHDDTEAVSAVRQYIEQYGESRFASVSLSHLLDRQINNRAGFRRKTDEGDEFLFLPETFKKEVVAGLNHKAALKALDKGGYLRRQGRDFSIKTKIIKRDMRLYCILGKILEDE